MNNRNRKVKIIEFIGLPGAGKTTLASEVIAELTKTGYYCHNHEQVFKNPAISNKWLNAMWFYLKNIKFTALLFLYTLLSSPLNRGHLQYNFGRLQQLMKMIVMFEKSLEKAGTAPVMIFDQGLVQCIWSITSLSGSVHKKFLKRCVALKKQIFPAIIVYVHTDPDTAARRIAERQSSCIFDHLSTADTKQLFCEQKGIFPGIISTLQEIYNPVVFNIEGNGFFKDNVDSLVGQLQNILEDERDRNRC